MKWLSAIVAIFCLIFIFGLGKFDWTSSMPCHGSDCAPMTEDCALHCWSESVAGETAPAIGVGLVILVTVWLAFWFSHRPTTFVFQPVFSRPHRDPKIILTTSKRE